MRNVDHSPGGPTTVLPYRPPISFANSVWRVSQIETWTSLMYESSPSYTTSPAWTKLKQQPSAGRFSLTLVSTIQSSPGSDPVSTGAELFAWCSSAACASKPNTPPASPHSDAAGSRTHSHRSSSTASLNSSERPLIARPGSSQVASVVE